MVKGGRDFPVLVSVTAGIMLEDCAVSPMDLVLVKRSVGIGGGGGSLQRTDSTSCQSE